MGKQWKKGAKADTASKRGAIFTKFVKEIQVASKLGGPDIDGNVRLKIAVDLAKAASCPKDTIEKAIMRGAGLLDDGKDIEELTYEGYGPHQVGVLVECQTDNRARTAAELRMLFTKAGGAMGELGSVAWMFDRIGLIEASKDQKVDLEEEAIEAGAQDVEASRSEGCESQTEASRSEANTINRAEKLLSDQAVFYTAQEDVGSVRDQLTNRGWSIKMAELSYKPKNFTELSDEQKDEVYDFLDKLEDHGDSHRVYASIH